MTPATTTALKKLKAHHKSQKLNMRQVFAKDARRFENFSASQNDLLLDYSKCGVSTKTMQLLFAIAKAAKVEAARDHMMRGDVINTTEHRAVLQQRCADQNLKWFL